MAWQKKCSVSALAIILLVYGCQSGQGSAGGRRTINEVGNSAVEFVKGSRVYIVAKPQTNLEHRALAGLGSYLEKVTGETAEAVASTDLVPAGRPAIVLCGGGVDIELPVQVPTNNKESFLLFTGKMAGRPVVVAAGNTDRGLKRAVQGLIIQSRQETNALVVPAIKLVESPWIAQREWTNCPWDPVWVRGKFCNPNADKRMSTYLYDERKLSQYVEMFDWMGFSGGQLIECCYSYGVYGSIETAQERQKLLARLLRENGQDVSLWVWTANFTGYGWFDSEAVYEPAAGKTAFEDPNVRRTFEKYYDKYAELAPCVDKFFAHFYDPGRLENEADVFRYIRLLESKLKARNPNIEMGIDGWAKGGQYLLDLQKNGFGDYILLTMPIPHFFTPGEREWLFAEAKKLNLKLAMWGWYTTEYETDQFASMYVNAAMMQKLYRELRDGALKIHPVEYWSEMEASHLNNIYTMYASGQLLWNPDRPWRDILEEFVCGIWGPVNGQKVLTALELIQDVRTGPSWETYWWRLPTHRVGTADANDDLRRAEWSLAELKGLEVDSGFVSKFPLPFGPGTFVELMLPHIEQIRRFSRFRRDIAEIRKAARQGASKEVLEKMLTDAWQPVPEFNTWVGTFGCPEIVGQKKMVEGMRDEFGLAVSDPPAIRDLEAERLLQLCRNLQRESKAPIKLNCGHPSGEFNWPERVRRDRFEKLIADGLLEKVGEDNYRLVDWKDLAED